MLNVFFEQMRDNMNDPCGASKKKKQKEGEMTSVKMIK